MFFSIHLFTSLKAHRKHIFPSLRHRGSPCGTLPHAPPPRNGGSRCKVQGQQGFVKKSGGMAPPKKKKNPVAKSNHKVYVKIWRRWLKCQDQDFEIKKNPIVPQHSKLKTSIWQVESVSFDCRGLTWPRKKQHRHLWSDPYFQNPFPNLIGHSDTAPGPTCGTSGRGGFFFGAEENHLQNQQVLNFTSCSMDQLFLNKNGM